jgi:hypothetical protein
MKADQLHAGAKANPGDKAGFDFEHQLPEGKEFFTVRQLATLWGVSLNHVSNLIDSGELEVSVDLRGLKSTKALLRVPRKSVVAFLNRRKRKP